MFQILLVIQILISIAIISLVLLQQGKGADMGAAFGSGASGTVFGARGSGSFFTRATAILAAAFFINCLLIASPLVRKVGTGEPQSLADQIEQQAIEQQEAADEDKIVETLEQLQAEQLEPQADDLPVVAPSLTADDLPESGDSGGAAGAVDDLPQ
jgi:preprotein translocase subunit SecG